MQYKVKKSMFMNIFLIILCTLLLSLTTNASRLTHGNYTYKGRLSVPAKAWLIMDAKTKKVIASKNANKRLAQASTTKIMTAYVIGRMIQKHQISFNTKIKISKLAAKTEGSRMVLKAGTKVPVKYLLKGLLVNSGNDAAVALAQGSAGSVKNFVKIMNQTAKALGLKNTQFKNPNGLPAAGHYSSAKDLAILTDIFIKKMPTIYRMCSSKIIRWNKRVRNNTNQLLWNNHLGVDGVKTGYTRNAKFCLVSSAKNKNKRVIAVILGANTLHERFSLSEKLLRYGLRKIKP